MSPSQLSARLSKRSAQPCSGPPSAQAAAGATAGPPGPAARASGRRRAETGDQQHHRHAVQHAEIDEAAREHQHRPRRDQQRRCRHLQPAAAEAPPAQPLRRGQGLPQAGAGQEQADDHDALQRPKGVGEEILRPVAEMAQVEAEVEGRHPEHGDAAQRIHGVDAAGLQRQGARGLTRRLPAMIGHVRQKRFKRARNDEGRRSAPAPCAAPAQWLVTYQVTPAAAITKTMSAVMIMMVSSISRTAPAV